MKKLVLATITGGIVGAVLILLFMFLFDTNKRHEQEGLQLVTNDSTENRERKQQMLMYGDYTDLDSTDYLLIPLGMKTLESPRGGLHAKTASASTEETTSVSNFQSYKYNFYSLNFEDCNNIIFYNKKTEETHLLLQKPAIISKFYFPYYDKEYTGKRYWFILLGIREDDSNADGYINADDAEKVYVADLSGANMIQVTPDNTQLIDWYIDNATNNILMKVHLDSNNDLRFNDYDDVDILKTKIDNLSQGIPIINKEIKSNIQGILKKIK
jgi:hypothetical protein